jgi:hypothetical protein
MAPFWHVESDALQPQEPAHFRDVVVRWWGEPNGGGHAATFLVLEVCDLEDTTMPVLLIPAIVGGTVLLLGGGYWIMHLH